LDFQKHENFQPKSFDLTALLFLSYDLRALGFSAMTFLHGGIEVFSQTPLYTFIVMDRHEAATNS